MLTFFRNIRKSLIDSGSAPKYLLYAIGEVALVVFGILIAFQINNWNDWRKDRIEEVEILTDLKESIELNIGFIQFSLQIDERGMVSNRILLDVIEKRKPWSDSLAVHIERALFVRPPILSFSSYKSLENKGIELIRSKELKKSIVHLYESQYNILLSVLTRITTIELKPTIDQFKMNFFVRKQDSLERTVMVPNDPISILANQKFENILQNTQLIRNTVFRNLEKQSLKESQRVLQLVKDELEKSE